MNQHLLLRATKSRIRKVKDFQLIFADSRFTSPDLYYKFGAEVNFYDVYHKCKDPDRAYISLFRGANQGTEYNSSLVITRNTIFPVTKLIWGERINGQGYSTVTETLTDGDYKIFTEGSTHRWCIFCQPGNNIHARHYDYYSYFSRKCESLSDGRTVNAPRAPTRAIFGEEQYTITRYLIQLSGCGGANYNLILPDNISTTSTFLLSVSTVKLLQLPKNFIEFKYMLSRQARVEKIIVYENVTRGRNFYDYNSFRLIETIECHWKGELILEYSSIGFIQRSGLKLSIPMGEAVNYAAKGWTEDIFREIEEREL